ncbi:hypothetical protein TSUD_160380 [Trifolium subterraneum]|uniref:Reverse transcriptase domain-containing protein n=1 Tax=Trifolium subterraneum TaxID=3900 RepID=A0A2Z6NZ03_TRISU|nr:hypothetical protein TSUD_160380 [Trifolium subterraneum]
MANSAWLILFPDVKLMNLLASHSDHSPILLQNTPMIRNGRTHSFRFENSWLKEEDIEEVVEDGWHEGLDSEITKKVNRCANKLEGWGRRKIMKFKQEVIECSEEMERLRGNNDMTSSGRYKEVQEKHARLLVQEEAYWKQRAKIHWLKEGDLNTKFFHMSASVRAKSKKIDKLVNEANIEVTTQQEICEVARNYLDQLFQANTSSHDPVLSLISPRVSQEENDRLVAPITKVELKNALFQMQPDKSPGPDGFNPAFYQHFWNICGDGIFEATKEWLERGYFPSSLNETNICLVPKCENPMSMQELRPISLCNVLYKMVSKLLANRLKPFLRKCVSEEQSAFVEGRSISDNALIAIEVIHALKRRTKGTRGELALKVDISKAYDKVDWGFLRGMLERMGFTHKWIHWMMLCVSSVNYSVLVNFEKVGPIFPGRGLRQDDPLSPYLFILVTEGLTTLIKNSVARGDLQGVKICRGAPLVSHLLFADDCFLFCRSTLEETNHLMSILKTYEDASGQEINMAKSEVFFSRNINMAAQEDLSRIMGVRHVLGTGTYLGLPSMIGRKKKETFAYVKDRIWKRINSWRGRALSRAGKEVMIKSVLQAIPSYVMSIYLLPESTIKEIERMINSFWWGGGPNNKGIRWLLNKDGNYDKAAYTSIKNLQGEVLSKFLSLFDSHLGNNPSYAWRSIWNSRQVLMNGCRWSIGMGTNINVMNDPWPREKDGVWMKSPQTQGRGENVVTAHEDWNCLWKVHAPPKAKNLLWRICRGCLPTRDHLQESVVARQSAGLDHVISSRLQHINTAKELIMHICKFEDKEVAASTSLTGSNTSKASSNSIRDFSFLKYFKIEIHQPKQTYLREVCWQPPGVNWLKCNIDGASNGNPGLSSCGGIFRNSSSDFVYGFAEPLGVATSFYAELCGAMRAIDLAFQFHWHNVWLETDSVLVVSASLAVKKSMEKCYSQGQIHECYYITHL